METIRLRRLPAFRAAVAASAGPNGLDKAITLILMGAICILMATLVAPAMRDNDQAGLIAGALQIARGEVPFDQAGFLQRPAHPQIAHLARRRGAAWDSIVEQLRRLFSRRETDQRKETE